MRTGAPGPAPDPPVIGTSSVPRSRRAADASVWRRAVYDTTPAPADTDSADAAEAVQVALDRRDNGGPSGR
ncbi:hypothetical protein GCM10023405_05970 [Streptomonospora salina]